MSGRARESYEETLDEDEYGWPQPRKRMRPRSVPSPPPRRRRRAAPFASAWAALALLGVALLIAAGVWYSQLDRSTPAAQLTVPRVVGLRQSVAVSRLTRLGLSVRAVLRPGDAKAGVVYAQRPAPSTTLDRGATVTIDVANGK